MNIIFICVINLVRHFDIIDNESSDFLSHKSNIDIFAFQCTNEYSDATRKFLIRPPRFQKLDPEIEIKDKIRKINLK